MSVRPSRNRRIGQHRARVTGMPDRFNNGSHYENHQRAAELHNLASHAHTTGELHGKSDHLTPHEQTALHAREPTTGHGVTAFGHDDIAALAHELWLKRGSPEGSPDEDWFHAVRELRARATSSTHNSTF